MSVQLVTAFGLAPIASSQAASDPDAKEVAAYRLTLAAAHKADVATQATIREGAYLIPIEGLAIDQLRRRHPFVRATAIPRNIYPGQDRVIPTIGLDMVIVCRRDLDEAVVHDLAQQLFDTFPRLSGVEASLRFLKPDRAPATPIPLHSGAARYFRERELSR